MKKNKIKALILSIIYFLIMDGCTKVNNDDAIEEPATATEEELSSYLTESYTKITTSKNNTTETSTINSTTNKPTSTIVETSNIISSNTTPSISTTINTTITTKENTTTEVSNNRSYSKITISAIGDCTIGTDINRYYENSLDQYYDKYGSSYFFKNVESIFNKDDLTIANLECALTNNSSHDDKKYVYGGEPEYADILKKANIEIVSLANNHSYDYLDDGYDDTLKSLHSYNIDYCHKNNVSYKNINGIKVAIISVKEGYGRETIKDCIDEAINNNADLQIVCIHWGKNYQSNYNYGQESLGHYIVDCGADLILGSHPHILQGIETYKGVNIVYSLGNFCYGGKKYLGEENDTIIYQQTFMIENNKIINSKTNIIPCYMSSSFPKNDYQPMEIKEKDEINRIKKKILNLSNNFEY